MERPDTIDTTTLYLTTVYPSKGPVSIEQTSSSTMATTSDDLRTTPSQAMDDMASPEFYDCFSSPKPLITPSKLFLGDCADEKAIDWTILENCNPNLVDTPKSVNRHSETKKIRKSLIPIFSPTPSERQPTGVLTASGSRSSKSRRISKEITEVLASRASSSGRKSTTDRDPLGLRDLSQSKEIAELKEKVAVLEAQNRSYETTIGGLQSTLTEQETLNAALRDEISAVCFFTQVQGQKIEEQESLLMTSKMDYQEEVSAKNRKYKTMIKKMQAEKASYENGANAIIKQLNEQMAELQKVALTRIQTLETQLMESRRAKDLLAKENVDLKALVAEQERALQQRETSASTSPSSSTATSSGSRSPLPASSSSSQARSLSPMAVARAHLHHMAAAHQPGRPAASTPKRGSTDEDDDEDDNTATPPAVNRRHPLTNKADVIASLAVSSPSFEA